MPKVSVIIPTYNRSNFLERAIYSVSNQSYDDFELIVVDDASTDDTKKILKNIQDPSFSYFRHETNQGGAAARNTGIKHSSGKYIAFLDDDDFWLPEKLEKQVEKLELNDKDFIGVYCGFIRIDTRNGKQEIIKGSKRYEENKLTLIRDLFTLDLELGGSSTLLIKHRYLNEIGGFDESFPRHQDWEFLLRLLKLGKLGTVEKPLVLKFRSSSPKARDVEKAKLKFLSRFEEDMRAFGKDFYRKALWKHYDQVARYYLWEKNFRKAYCYFSKTGGSILMNGLKDFFGSLTKEFFRTMKGFS